MCMWCMHVCAHANVCLCVWRYIYAHVLICAEARTWHEVFSSLILYILFYIILETGPHCRVHTGLKLTVNCLPLPNLGIKGVHCHNQAFAF